MQDDIQKILDDNLKSQQNIIGVIATILATLISAILTQAGKITLEVALLIDIPIIVILLFWIIITTKKSNINWDKFYDMLVRMKALEEYSINKDINITLEVYNNYITFLYLAALYEGKEKFAQELLDKAKISDKPEKRII